MKTIEGLLEALTSPLSDLRQPLTLSAPFIQAMQEEIAATILPRSLVFTNDRSDQIDCICASGRVVSVNGVSVTHLQTLEPLSTFARAARGVSMVSHVVGSKDICCEGLPWSGGGVPDNFDHQPSAFCALAKVEIREGVIESCEGSEHETTKLIKIFEDGLAPQTGSTQFAAFCSDHADDPALVALEVGDTLVLALIPPEELDASYATWAFDVQSGHNSSL